MDWEVSLVGEVLSTGALSAAPPPPALPPAPPPPPLLPVDALSTAAATALPPPPPPPPPPAAVSMDKICQATPSIVSTAAQTERSIEVISQLAIRGLPPK